MNFILTTFFLVNLYHGKLIVNQQYDYIIVGAGISGIGASEVLTRNGIKHLMIEANTHIGGRVASFEFSGQTHDLGSRQIHYPEGDNTIHNFIENNNITTIRSDFFSQAAYYVNKSQVSTIKGLIPAVPIIISLQNFIKEQIDNGNYSKDVPLNILIDKFWEMNPNITGYLKDRVNQFMQIVIFATGADIKDIDAYERMPHPIRFFDDDYTVKGGFHNLVKQMFKKICKPDLHTAEIVYRVDYSGPKIRLYTNKAIYEAKNVFLSFSLGILKKKWIQFIPDLPQEKQNAIQRLGFGVLQRLYVTFKEPFWPEYAGTVTFTGKNKLSKYPFSWVCKDSKKNMLVFTITGSVAVSIEKMTRQQLKKDLQDYLQNYLPTQHHIQDIHLTRWHHNSLTLGSVTYMKVGAGDQDILILNKPINVGEESKMWFIGQHTSPKGYSYAHGAHQSGIKAALQALGQ